MNHHARRQFGDAVAEAETREVARLRAENANLQERLEDQGIEVDTYAQSARILADQVRDLEAENAKLRAALEGSADNG